MNAHFLKINPDKTELLMFHPKALHEKIIIKGTNIGNECIRLSSSVKNVGVWLDENLNLDKQVNSVVASCYKQLKDIGKIRNIISKNHTEMLVHAIISSRLDYCNSIYYDMKKSNLYKLQKVQNSAARLIERKKRRHPVRAIFKELHWLNVEARIIFKIILIVYKCINGKYSKNLNIDYKKYNCRANEYLLLEPKNAKTKHGKRTFDYAGPRLWNALPLHVRTEENIEKFKKSVKTILFDDIDSFKKKAYKY